jgi:Cd2+/Zn2+-exporting ATPase
VYPRTTNQPTPAWPWQDGQKHADHHHDHCCSSIKRALETLAAPRSEGELTVTPIRILQMDCPTEEALIRKQLASMSEVVALEFRLMQRVLTVTHQRRTAGHSGSPA